MNLEQIEQLIQDNKELIVGVGECEEQRHFLADMADALILAAKLYGEIKEAESHLLFHETQKLL